MYSIHCIPCTGVNDIPFSEQNTNKKKSRQQTILRIKHFDPLYDSRMFIAIAVVVVVVVVVTVALAVVLQSI